MPRCEIRPAVMLHEPNVLSVSPSYLNTCPQLLASPTPRPTRCTIDVLRRVLSGDLVWDFALQPTAKNLHASHSTWEKISLSTLKQKAWVQHLSYNNVPLWAYNKLPLNIMVITVVAIIAHPFYHFGVTRRILIANAMSKHKSMLYEHWVREVATWTERGVWIIIRHSDNHNNTVRHSMLTQHSV